MGGHDAPLPLAADNTIVIDAAIRSLCGGEFLGVPARPDALLVLPPRCW